MDQIEKKWKLQPQICSGDDIPGFFKDNHIHPIIAGMLMRRGIRTRESFQHFFFDTPKDFANPFLMKGVKEAAERIFRAVKDKEPVVIYGDYDVDGITSTSTLYLCLRDMGAEVDYYIPSRENEGYGLNQNALKQLADKGTKLLITVDCGISSAALIAEAPSGMDIIVTDHHQLPDVLPPALAVINPQQKDCAYPCKDLAGVGVAFTLCRALHLQMDGSLYTGNIELAALGTIADMVPLLGENRILVRAGLERIAHTDIPGLNALIACIGWDSSKITSEQIAFGIAPRLNAAGRVAHAWKGVRLLTTDSEEEAKALALELNETNVQRQTIEKDICLQAEKRIEELRAEHDNVLVVDGKEWHPGVIGIVASRLTKSHGRPSFVLSVKDGIGKGSCRSIPAFNIYEALKSADDLLIQFGGHKMAAGFSIQEKMIPSFRERMNQYAAEHLKPEDYVPEIDIEGKMDLSDVTVEFIHSLASLEPYGCGNPNPLFMTEPLRLESMHRIGKDLTHLKLRLSQGDTFSDAVWWGMGEEYTKHLPGDWGAVVYAPRINSWNGEHVQLIVEDAHFGKKTDISLDRDILVQTYRAAKALFRNSDITVFDTERSISYRLNGQVPGLTVYAALRIFEELGILTRTSNNGREYYRFNSVGQKLNLSSSLTYMKYSH